MAAKRNFNVSSGIKTYATAENAEKAFLAKFGNTDVAYIIVKLEPHNCDNAKVHGRYVPAALGQKAIEEAVHFSFHVVG